MNTIKGRKQHVMDARGGRSLHRPTFELYKSMCHLLRSEADEPAKSQITCFSGQAGGLRRNVNLQLEGVWITADSLQVHTYADSLQPFLHTGWVSGTSRYIRPDATSPPLPPAPLGF